MSETYLSNPVDDPKLLACSIPIKKIEDNYTKIIFQSGYKMNKISSENSNLDEPLLFWNKYLA